MKPGSVKLRRYVYGLTMITLSCLTESSPGQGLEQKGTTQSIMKDEMK